jgi:hypothetical protein
MVPLEYSATGAPIPNLWALAFLIRHADDYGIDPGTYLMRQPVFQYYWDVGGNSRVSDAAVMGFRAIIDF